MKKLEINGLNHPCSWYHSLRYENTKKLTRGIVGHGRGTRRYL